MRKSKIISVFMTAIMVASAIPVPAFAASIGSSSTDTSVGADTKQNVQTQYEEIAPNDTQTQVYLTVEDSDLIVSLPTTVIVSGTPDEQGKYIGKYSVGVAGNMSGDKIVNISPDNTSIELHQKGKSGKTATIDQSQTEFSTNDFKNNTQTTGIIMADKLTAGSWSGTFNFNIKTIAQPIPNDYTILYKYDLSALNTDDVAAYYCVPTSHTVKIDETSSANAISTCASQENNQTVIYKGIKYTLSDDDTLVISGQGNMKENVQSDFYNYAGLYQAVSEHFGMPYHINPEPWTKDTPYDCYIEFPNNAKYASYFKNYKKYASNPLIEKEWNGVTIDDINSYIDTIVEEYATMKTPKNVIIEAGVNNISKSAFAGSETLENVKIANTVTKIEERAFESCTALSNIDLSNNDNLVTIGSYAFQNCKNLETIKLGKNITEIGSYAFAGSSKLKNINLPQNLLKIEGGSFSGCRIENMYVDCDKMTNLSDYNYIFGNDNKYLPKNIYYSSPEKFKLNNLLATRTSMWNVDYLTNIYINNKLLKDVDFAFSTSYYGSSIESLRIDKNATSDTIYGTSVKFSGCDNLKTIYIPVGVAVSGIESQLSYYKNKDVTIYCETQDIAEKITSKYPLITVIVDNSKF